MFSVAPHTGIGPIAAGAALLSLAVTMWPFVPAMANLRQVGFPDERLGLKRSAIWLALANLACLVLSFLGSYVSFAWGQLVPAVNDPFFQIARQHWAIPLDLLPFFLLTLTVKTLSLWGLNLRLPRGEQVRRPALALLAAGQTALTYLVLGLTIYAVLIASFGGYRPVELSQVRKELADAEARIWYVLPEGEGGAVRSMRLDGSDDCLEWTGPAPPDGTFWVAPRERVLIFAQADRLTVVDLAGGGQVGFPASQTDASAEPRPPATPQQVAESLPPQLPIPEQAIWPRDFFRAAGEGELPRSAQSQDLEEARRDVWLRELFGVGQPRPLPEAPARRGWINNLELQSYRGLGTTLLIGRYGQRLLVMDIDAGWVTPLGVRVDRFAVAPAARGGARGSD